MREQAILMGTLVVCNLLTVGVPIRADGDGCTATVAVSSCTFHCHDGDRLGLRVVNEAGVGVHAAVRCGGLSGSCQELILTQCQANFQFVGEDDNLGQCTLLQGTTAECANEAV